jgi:hypothetical protein
MANLVGRLSGGAVESFVGHGNASALTPHLVLVPQPWSRHALDTEPHRNPAFSHPLSTGQHSGIGFITQVELGGHVLWLR